MPAHATADIVHTAGTDHRIVRRPLAATPMGEESDRLPVPFYGDRQTRPGVEAKRDLGVALTEMALAGKGKPPLLAGRAVELLEDALAGSPDDVRSWVAKGQSLWLLGRGTEALASFDSALSRSPGHERGLLAASMVAQARGQTDKALASWRNWSRSTPGTSSYQANLAALLAHIKDWPGALAVCDTLLRLDPGHVEGRQLRIRCLLETGDKAAARKEMETARRLRPANPR